MLNCFFYFLGNTVFMTDSPPPYPGIQPGYGYASGPPHQGAGGVGMGQSGTPGWANPNYNGQPMSQAGAYPGGYGQPPYSGYSPNPPPYSAQSSYAQPGSYQQPGSYPYPPQY